MKAHILWRHLLVVASTICGIIGMGIVFDAALGGGLAELGIGIPMLFIGLWWSGRELGLSMMAGKARKARVPKP
ncbi:MAG TPA: hypothetical protein VKX16_19060 [Chloroflexota bacterium]|nr:hypothetical protein [Chloroflexota bacterium]